MVFLGVPSVLPECLRRGHAILIVLGFTAAALVNAPAADAAGSRLCRQLEAELAGARRSAPPARVQRYDAAIERQLEQMAVAREQARDAGCGYALSGSSIRTCASINATLDRMVRNLDALERRRARLAPPEPSRSRAAILAALDANGCFEAPEFETTPLGDMLAAPDEGVPYDGEQLDSLFGADAALGERFRTLCVRSCDGYFYPMSNGATVSEFERDLRKCEASCTGTDMQIFYGPPGSEDIGSMQSTRSGEPYSRLPTAFLHQDVSVQRPAGCGCGVAKSYEIIAGTPPPDETPAQLQGGAERPLPATPSGDAEDGPQGPAKAAGSPANVPAPSKLSGSIIAVPPPAPAQPPASVPPEPAAAAPAEPPANRAVRVVGPEFLPDPAEAIDLRTTDPTSAR